MKVDEKYFDEALVLESDEFRRLFELLTLDKSLASSNYIKQIKGVLEPECYTYFKNNFKTLSHAQGLSIISGLLPLKQNINNFDEYLTMVVSGLEKSFYDTYHEHNEPQCILYDDLGEINIRDFSFYKCSTLRRLDGFSPYGLLHHLVDDFREGSFHQMFDRLATKKADLIFCSINKKHTSLIETFIALSEKWCSEDHSATHLPLKDYVNWSTKIDHDSKWLSYLKKDLATGKTAQEKRENELYKLLKIYGVDDWRKLGTNTNTGKKWTRAEIWEELGKCADDKKLFKIDAYKNTVLKEGGEGKQLASTPKAFFEKI